MQCFTSTHSQIWKQAVAECVPVEAWSLKHTETSWKTYILNYMNALWSLIEIIAVLWYPVSILCSDWSDHSVEHLSALAVFYATNDSLLFNFFFICSTSFILFFSRNSFYSPVFLPLYVSSYLPSSTSLCCRPLWISGNRSTFSQ